MRCFASAGEKRRCPGFLKMVAIGTVADVAKLVGENRAIVALGLADLPRAVNPGLRALIEIAGCGDDSEMTAYDLGFRIGPRINAAGRMDAARAVVELFEANDKEEARRLAEHLDTRNRERMEAQREIFNRAIEEFESSGTDMSQTSCGSDCRRRLASRGDWSGRVQNRRATEPAVRRDFARWRHRSRLGAQYRGLSPV